MTRHSTRRSPRRPANPTPSATLNASRPYTTSVQHLRPPNHALSAMKRIANLLTFQTQFGPYSEITSVVRTTPMHHLKLRTRQRYARCRRTRQPNRQRSASKIYSITWPLRAYLPVSASKSNSIKTWLVTVVVAVLLPPSGGAGGPFVSPGTVAVELPVFPGSGGIGGPFVSPASTATHITQIKASALRCFNIGNLRKCLVNLLTTRPLESLQ